MAFKRNGGGGKRPPLEYVYTGTTYREVNGEKVEDAQEEWQLAITIPVETRNGATPLDDLITKLTEVRDTNGDLGARIVLYVSPRENEKSGETFSATNILVQAKRESKQQAQGGGGFRGKQKAGGRKSYPPKGSRSSSAEEDGPPEYNEETLPI